jgi:hypothetical protein
MANRALGQYVVAVSFFLLISPLRLEAQAAAFAMTVEEFGRLSPADQKTIVSSAFEHRLKQARNMYYESQTRLSINEYQMGKLGNELLKLNGGNYRQWKLGTSYRIDTVKGGADVSKPAMWVSSGFDSDAALGRYTVRFAEAEPGSGRIDVVEDPVIFQNRYLYWLDGKHKAQGEFLIRYLFDHRDNFIIASPARKNYARLIVPWQPMISDTPIGTREVLLDVSKGFLPIEGKGSWKLETSEGETWWRTEEFYVESSQLVGDVWMPTKLKELVGADSLGSGKVNVWETEVSKIEVGSVKATDLVIPFPKGMNVVDAIKGTAYVVGDEGEMTQVERLVGAGKVVPPEAPPPTTRGISRIMLAMGGTIAVMSLLGLWFYRKNRSQKLTAT